MSFTTLSGLLTLHEAATPIKEDQDELGMGPKPHPVLSRAEIVRFYDKIDQARNKLEEIESIFKHAPGATGTAHKLHHIGVKAGSDLSHIDTVQTKINELFDAIDDLHQDWGTSMQQDTGAFDEPEVEPAPEEGSPDEDLGDPNAAPTDELPPDEDAVQEGLGSSTIKAGIGAAITYALSNDPKLAAGVAAGSLIYDAAAGIFKRMKRTPDMKTVSVKINDGKVDVAVINK